MIVNVFEFDVGFIDGEEWFGQDQYEVYYFCQLHRPGHKKIGSYKYDFDLERFFIQLSDSWRNCSNYA